MAAPADAPAPRVTRNPELTKMAPGQVPHQPAPWRATHSFLLSPLMGLLSRAWSHLRGPGPPEPWLVEAVTRADAGEPGLEGDTKASLATQPQEEPGERRATEEDEEASWGSYPDLEAKCLLLETWGLSDDERGGEAATRVPREPGSEFMDGLPAPLSPSLLMRAQQDVPGEEESQEEAVTEDKDIITFAFPLSHWEGCPGVAVEEEEEAGEAVNKEAPRTSTSPSAPGPQPRSWVCCAVEGATEEERTENKAATKPSTCPSSLGSHPGAWECCSGEEPEEEEDRKVEKREAGPEPHSAILAQSPLLGTRQHQSREISEEEDEEKDEDRDLGAAEGPSSNLLTNAFLRAWVYRPGEDTEEEEDGDSDEGAAEEEGEAEEEREAEGPSSSPHPSAFFRAWVYRPGEDTEEEEEDRDSDAGAAEEEGEAGPPSVPPTSAFLRAWVYRPGEDTEEEDDDEEEEDGESEAAVWGPSPSLQAQRALRRDQMYQPGKGTEGGEAAEEREEAEPCPFRVAIYLPGEKTPPPWAPSRLPLRLQRRLKPAETPTSPARHQDPEPPRKTRKVRFSEKVSVHLLAVWAGPAQAARRGPWEQFARDRSRFARRIAQAEEVLGPYLTPAARARAWARLGNPSTSLATLAAPTQTLPMSPILATPLSHDVASAPHPWVSPGLDLSGRRG